MRLAFLLILVVLAAVFLTGVRTYLSPDDFVPCNAAPSRKAGCGSADAVVAISGGDTTARTRQAIQLYKSGWAPHLVFSGAARDKSGPSNAEVMRMEAIRAGVSEAVIFIEQDAATTAQNAQNIKALLKQQNVRSIILVTSAYHQRRASLEFAKNLPGVEVRSYPLRSDNQWPGQLWWLNPFSWYLALSELIKIAVLNFGNVVK